MVLNVIIVILLIIIFASVKTGISELKEESIYTVSTFNYYFENGQYDKVYAAYCSDYDPIKKYKDEELLCCYAAAQYYEHAGAYLAAEAFQDTKTAELEKVRMENAYSRMGDYQIYADNMLQSLKR